MYLGEIAKGRNNNLNVIRFIAAALVILCHAYPISLGNGQVDILGRLTNDQMHFGNLAVCIFFFYGGFLIAKSAERLQTGKKYFIARISRIFPGMIVVTFILAFIVGPIITTESLGSYFTNGQTYKYLLNSVMVLVHDLPGVFTDNIYNSTVNGPLWTQPVEFLCYIMCFIVLKVGFLNEKKMKWTVPVFVVGYLMAWKVLGGNETLASALRPAGLFYVGMLYYTYRDKIKIHWIGAVISAVALIVSAMLQILPITVFIFLPYLLCYLGYGTPHKWADFGKHGEVSYGVYLCGWPIQQILCQQFGGSMNPILNFVIALPLAIVCGYLLHWFVEKPISEGVKKIA